MWNPSNFLKAVVVFVGYFLLCNFTSVGALCSGAIMPLVQCIWLYMLSMKFSRSLEEMKDELGSLKDQLRIFSETLSQKVKELENATDEKAALRQKREASLAHVGEVDVFNTGGKIGEKFGLGLNESKLGLYNDSGIESMVADAPTSPSGISFSPADPSFSPADTSISPADTPASQANTPVSPAADKRTLESEDFPDPKNFTDFGHYYYTVSSFFNALINMGYTEAAIINSFITSIPNSYLAKTFFYKIENKMPKNIDDLLYALGFRDKEFMEKTPEQRFRDLVRGKDETLEHFLSRCHRETSVIVWERHHT